ncbi:MAG: hypothetical protein U0573_08630 [Phycisphaerales bacterium]|nr:hypothetical protein [Planctomycetota bacterium]
MRTAAWIGSVCALALVAGSTLAGVTITGVNRSLAAKACVNAPPNTLNWCESDSSSNTVEGPWTAALSFGPGAAGAIGSATAIAQVSQSGDINATSIQAIMGIYTYISANGTCSGSNDAANVFEVEFNLSLAADLILGTTVSGDGFSFLVTVSQVGGFVWHSSYSSENVSVPLGVGDWKLRIEAHNSLACGPCFASRSANIQTYASFDFGPCAGDLNGDLLVDDADFSIFVVAYNDLLCPDYPDTCLGDLNGDAYVDDADFSIFVVAYDELICP